MTPVSGSSKCERNPAAPRIGITGHIGLSARTTDDVHRRLGECLDDLPAPPMGVTCLAAGADQLFARAILDRGGAYEVILPAEDYRESVVTEEQRPAFDELIFRAANVVTMPFVRSSRRAYMAASRELIRRSDLLFAVWDGSRSGDLGETGEVVAVAKHKKLPVEVLWPSGATRTRVTSGQRSTPG